MMKRGILIKVFLFFSFVLIVSTKAYSFVSIHSLFSVDTSGQPLANADTSVSRELAKKMAKEDFKKQREIIPRKATIRSAIIPGWGQAYNGSYWKIPVVYAALGVTTYIFFDNVKTYRDFRLAYRLLRDTIPENNELIPDYIKPLSEGTVRLNRDEFRRYIDYSVLFFLFFWGLNVVEATVDAHLKNFDVSEELSLELKPGYSPMANTAGISIVLNIGKRSPTLPKKPKP
jgi:hypothetical protein